MREAVVLRGCRWVAEKTGRRRDRERRRRKEKKKTLSNYTQHFNRKHKIENTTHSLSLLNKRLQHRRHRHRVLLERSLDERVRPAREA